MEDHPEAVTLKLNHSRLESESEIDRFLNHLDNDTLLGLQLRMTPIEYAIHVIQSRNQIASANDSESLGSTETVTTDNHSTNRPIPTTDEMEPLIDDEHCSQEAPSCIRPSINSFLALAIQNSKVREA